MKRLLITGYPGWLTTRFLETALNYTREFDAIRVLSLDANVQRGFSFGEIEVSAGDLRDPNALDNACRDTDTVLHAAGVLHVKKISDFYSVNTRGTENLLEAAIKNRVRRFLYVSSNAAQGFSKGPQDKLTEKDACRPKSDYGKSKYQAEQIVQKAFAGGRIETVIIRPAMFYGPPVAERHLDIYRRIQKGRFPLFGNGNYARSITYIDNLIQAIHLALVKPQAAGQIYTITDKEIPTLLDILEVMADNLGVPLKVQRYPAFLTVWAEKLDALLASAGIYWMIPHIVGEACRHIAYSISKAEQELGYKPEVNYTEGYRRTMMWCKERKLL